jgi:hypothetical protein
LGRKGKPTLAKLEFYRRREMAFRDIPIVLSSNIKAVLHDADTQELIVHFNNGGSYSYQGVSVEKADGFTQADSAGKYLHNNIKGQHVHTKIG